MRKLHFTDIAIKAMKAPDRGQITYWDAALPAFGLRVSQGGAKTWTVVHGEQRKRISIGRYPVVSLQQARAEAKRVQVEIAQGETGGVGMRFGEALALFLTTHCAVKNKPGTAKETERLLRRHFAPVLDKRVLEDISTQDFTAIVDRALDTPSEAQHAFTAGKTFFGWAARRRYIKHSPADRLLAASKSVARDRVLSDAELARVLRDRARPRFSFWNDRRTVVADGTAPQRNWIAAASLRRRASAIDHSAGCADEERARASVPIRLAARTLRETVENGEVLFAARGTADKSFCGWSKAKLAFDRQCGIAHWTLHDLRRTFSTIHARIGTPPHITERMLNHQVGTLTAIAKIYNRYSYMDEMRAAMFNYEQELMRILSLERI